MPFLEHTIERNPGLIRAAVALHQERRIPPNTYVVDLDAFLGNGFNLLDEADRLGLRVYFMTKQIGRNPLLFKPLTAGGRAKTVSVDIQDAKALHAHGIPLGHVGNVSQISTAELFQLVAAADPEVISVFSEEKALAVAHAARRVGRDQAVLLRVRGENDIVAAGATGGIALGELPAVVEHLLDVEGLLVAGVSTWPAVAYTSASQPQLAPNIGSMREGLEVLRSQGVEEPQMNAPGNTSIRVLPTLADAGATQVEPGSALSGHATLNLSKESPERPAVVYLTEISHYVDDEAWVLGGGFFLDDPPVPELRDFGSRRRALVGTTPEAILDSTARFLGTSGSAASGFGAIDYYGTLELRRNEFPIGASVVFGFRTQAFMTRANIAIVSGLEAGSPELEGLFDVRGRELDASWWW